MTTHDRNGHQWLVFNAMSLVAGDGVLQADGSIWSHAATLGTHTKGTPFTIDQKTVENFVRVFKHGYPSKVPVDYDHALTSMDPEVIRARAMGKVPKAGDVLDMQGVFSVTDFTGSLRTAAETLAAGSARKLDDSRNLGLWIRWRPTAKALQAIQAREYSELSITFDDNWPNSIDGQGQGPAIIAVALTNLPFLDQMLPVAANRIGQPAASPPSPTEGESMPERQLTLISAVAALIAKPVTDEGQAATELAAFTPDVTAMRAFRTDVAAEIGEADPTKAVAKVRELKASVTKFEAEVKAAKAARVKAEVDATLKKYEARLTVPLKEMLGLQLQSELEAGTELAKTKAIAALESLKDLGIVGQHAAGNIGGAGEGDDAKLDARAQELMTTNPRLKAMVDRGESHEAYKQALSIAAKDIGYGRRTRETATA